MARKSKPARKTDDGGLPTKEQILEFIGSSQDRVGKREIARAFGIKGGARIALKHLLNELAAEGRLRRFDWLGSFF